MFRIQGGAYFRCHGSKQLGTTCTWELEQTGEALRNVEYNRWSTCEVIRWSTCTPLNTEWLLCSHFSLCCFDIFFCNTVELFSRLRCCKSRITLTPQVYWYVIRIGNCSRWPKDVRTPTDRLLFARSALEIFHRQIVSLIYIQNLAYPGIDSMLVLPCHEVEMQ